MILMTQAQSADVTSEMKTGTPRKMMILMTKEQISFITLGSTV